MFPQSDRKKPDPDAAAPPHESEGEIGHETTETVVAPVGPEYGWPVTGSLTSPMEQIMIALAVGAAVEVAADMVYGLP